MNTRINEIAQQSYVDADAGDGVYQRLSMQKFAELLLKEFSKQVQIEGRFGLEREQTLIRLCCENAMKHFGVEQ